ncbi:unnamed protein product [Polarella glacialis]|uniref:RING-type domain-containing protein n=1 Tax=Polarella glacialis TaxID=89957 RepID=A0A813D9S4_POLGL|nr:unnamed protein product [Polarella glacialis]
MMGQHFLPQQQGGQPVPQDEGDEDDLDTEEEDAEDATRRYNKGADGFVTSSAKLLRSLPKTRLSEALEAIDARFDATVTADLLQASLSRLLWVLTRVKPTTRVFQLRIKSYFQMFKLFKTANLRLVKRMSQFKYEEEILTPITVAPDDDIINQVSTNLGFQAEWLIHKGKSSGQGTSSASGIQLPITSMFVRPDGAGSVELARLPEPEQAQPNTLGLTAVSKAGPPPVAFAVPPPTAPVAVAVPPQTHAMVDLPPGAPVAMAVPANTAVPKAVPQPVALQMQGMLAQLQPAEIQQLMQQMMSQLPQPQPDRQPDPQPQPTDSAPLHDRQPDLQPDPELSMIVAREVDPEIQMCAFCQHDIDVGSGEALQCGHVFHMSCLADYMSATGKEKGGMLPT